MNPRRKIDTDQLLTSTQVRERLDISPSTLTTLVEKGVIEKVIPTGYTNGYYTKTSVDEYLKQQNLFMHTYSLKRENKLEIRKAVGEDQPGILEMEKEVLGATLPLEKRVELYKKNPDIDFIAIKGNSVIGHLSLYPLSMKTIRLLLEGKLRGWEVTADDLEVYKEGKQYNLFVMAIAVRKSEQEAASIYAGLLLREAQKHIFEMASENILVKAIYATSRTKDGIYLSGRLGMDTLSEFSDAHRKAFVLDVEKSETHWVKEYKNYIATLNPPSSSTEDPNQNGHHKQKMQKRDGILPPKNITRKPA